VILWELSPHLHSKLKLILCHLVDERVNTEWSWVFTIDAIVHDKEFAIWWFDCNRLHRLKVTHVHTFVEIAVVENYASLYTIYLSFAYLEIIVEDESQLWIVLEVALHLNHTIDRCINHHSIRIEQDGQLFKDVYENFVRLFLLLFTIERRYGLLDGCRSNSA